MVLGLLMAVISTGTLAAQEEIDLFKVPSLINKSKKANLANRLSLPTEAPLPKLPNDGPIQEDKYLLGPGDLLTVYLGNSARYPVTPEGFVLLPDIPPVNVSGKSLSESKRMLKSALAKQYDTAKVYITLAAPNTFKAQVMGEVVNPGAKSINSFTRVVEALATAGGFTKYSIRDRIKIKHPSGDTSVIPLSTYYSGFKEEGNPYLNIGDMLIIETVRFDKPFCTVKSGDEVYFHQIEGNTSVKEIYAQVNNYAQSSPPAHCRIRKGASKGTLLLTPDQMGSYLPADKDTVEFLKDVEFVFVGGAVLRPQLYDYVPTFRIGDYLFLAGVTLQSDTKLKYTVTRNKEILSGRAIFDEAVRPGDKIFLERNKVELTRDYLTILASLAGIVLTAATLYYTTTNNN
ncbi:MAG TPA: polysaccharide biosynthesis/export family protein [Fibrobacteria bacterium]|nr:polysaccharide biosynthesis/export family protein [Fibrobacteria bacterium]